MANPSRYPNAPNDKRMNSGEESPPKTPRWVKLFGIIVLLLILAFVIVKLIGVGGDHGPGRHSLSDSTNHQAVRSSVISVGEGSSFDLEDLAQGSTYVLGGQNGSFGVSTMSQAVQESAVMDAARYEVTAYRPIDYLTSRVAGLIQA